ncbi:major facilitator superfamily domain-containing protein [Abortiporus biennis]|nr:major facilitator superfamily domain-containing protein [Abortiporus biennis]
MSHPEVLSTALDIPKPKKWFSIPIKPVEVLRRRRVTNERPQDDHQDPEFKLPKRSSLIIVIVLNLLMQLSFFIIVSSSNLYAAHLGGSATFSGLVIGIPTLISGLCLLPLMKIDQGVYRRPMHFACGSAVLGHILYAIAYKVNFLYLILLGRIVNGLTFTFFMYAKKYCSDSRIVGVRRRTFLAGWLVVTQALGFSLGPFMGGLLYKVGFSNDIFNGYTSPAWVMAIIWSIFWLVSTFLFEDVPLEPPVESEVEMTSMENINIPEGKEDSRGQSKASSTAQVTNIESVSEPERFRMSSAQWGVTATMIWFAMTCFFVLGAWEANIPAFTGSDSPLSPFHFSPFAAGNLIALGGACTFPFLFLNIFVARKIQDRITLAVGSSLGCAGLFIALAILKTRTVNYGSFFICWFLVALGFNLASTVTLSLLSKQLPGKWNSKVSIMIQCGNYTGRVTGAVWGGAGVQVGMLSYVGLQIAILGIGVVMFSTLWRNLKAKTG